MFTRFSIMIMCILGICVWLSPAAAQETTGEAPGREGVERKPAERGERPGSVYRQGLYRDTQEQLEDLKSSVGIDGAQEKDIGDALKAFEARRDEIHDEYSAQPPDEQNKIRAIREARAKALTEQDREGLKMADDELTALRSSRRERYEAGNKLLREEEQKLHDRISGLLREDQKAKFEQYWDNQLVGRYKRQGPTRNPRALKTFVERLPSYTSQQREYVEALFKAYQAEERDLKPGDDRKPAWMKRTEKLYDEVYAVLSDEQKKAVDEKLQGSGGKRRAGRAGGDERRTGQPDRPNGAGTP